MPTSSGPSRLEVSENTTTAAMKSIMLPLVLDWSGSRTTWFSAKATSPPRSTSGRIAGNGSWVARKPARAHAAKPRATQ